MLIQVTELKGWLRMSFYSSLYRAVRIGLLNKVKWSRDVQGCAGMSPAGPGGDGPSPSHDILTAPAALTLPGAKSKPPRLLQKTSISLKPFFISYHVTSHILEVWGIFPFSFLEIFTEGLFMPGPHRAWRAYTLWMKKCRPHLPEFRCPWLLPIMAICWLSGKPSPCPVIHPESYSHLWAFTSGQRSLFCSKSCSMTICWLGLSWRAEQPRPKSKPSLWLFSHESDTSTTPARADAHTHPPLVLKL